MRNKVFYPLIILITIAIIFLVWLINREEPIEERTERINVIVSIIPQKYFVEKIGGNKVNVTYMVEKGASPDIYEPKPSQMEGLKEADIYIKIGVPFEESQLPNLQNINQRMEVIDQGKNVPLLQMTGHHHDSEAEDENEIHYDPHIWLSPKRAKQQAQNIYNALIRIDGANTEYYGENLSAFEKEIDTLDNKIKVILTDLNSKDFLVFHPAFGYFADDYSLIQNAIEIEGKEPSVKEMEELIQLAQQKKFKTIYIQLEFSQDTAEKIANQINATITVLDPLAEDWAVNLESIAQSLKENN